MRVWREHRTLDTGANCEGVTVATMHRWPVKDGRKHVASTECWCTPFVYTTLSGPGGVRLVEVHHRVQLQTLTVPDALPEDLGGGSL